MGAGAVDGDGGIAGLPQPCGRFPVNQVPVSICQTARWVVGFLIRDKKILCQCVSMAADGQLRTYGRFTYSIYEKRVLIEELPSTLETSGAGTASAGLLGELTTADPVAVRTAT